MEVEDAARPVVGPPPRSTVAHGTRRTVAAVDLVVAANPDPDSHLPYLLHVPVGDGLAFATKDTWPRTAGLYCHPLPAEAWPAADEVQVVERVPLRACSRRGAAIDVVADRGRENRSQIVYTHARGRQMVFWQSPRTRKQARPDVRTPTARAAGLAELEVVVDAHERYPWSFADQKGVRTVRRGLACGDYAVLSGGRVVAAVERKSMTDLVSTLTSGRLRYALGELAALPRAAVVVEESYAKVFAQDHVRPAVIADGLAEVQVAWPTVPVVFCDTRKIAQEWTYGGSPRRWPGWSRTRPAQPLPASTGRRRPWRPVRRRSRPPGRCARGPARRGWRSRTGGGCARRSWLRGTRPTPRPSHAQRWTLDADDHVRGPHAPRANSPRSAAGRRPGTADGPRSAGMGRSGTAEGHRSARGRRRGTDAGAGPAQP